MAGSKRKMTLLMPFDTVAGKLSEVSKKKRLYVAYSTNARPGNIYFQAKLHLRKSSPSADELANRSKFRTCTDAMNDWMTDPTKITIMTAAFRKHATSGGQYATMRGFVMSRAWTSYNDSTHQCDFNTAFPTA